jgi:rSAM/selenodomain-associated transferase 1
MTNTQAPVLVFAKAPAPGRVKTRLARRLGNSEAAAWAEAFLIDTWQALAIAPGVAPVLVLDGDAPLPLLTPPPVIWSQGDGDLGERLERALRRALATSPAAIAVGTDSPGLPQRCLQRALMLLASGHQSVLGPADDGGFYALGLRHCPPGLLTGLPWSATNTRQAVSTRLAEHGMIPALLEPWYDVDDVAGLERLRADLSEDRVVATFCAARFKGQVQSPVRREL